MSRHGTTAIARLRLHGGGSTATELRAARIIARASMYASGLPAPAVLCVRRLADPRPGALRIDPSAIRPPPEWDAAASRALELELRGAARPAREAVPAGANAVLFADRSELLACLALDWLSGNLASRWWWMGLIGRELPRRGVLAAWTDEPRYAPAALELLAARGQAVAFTRAHGREAAVALAVAVAEAWALPVLAVAAASPGAPPPKVVRRPAPRTAAPPWRTSVPETQHGPLPAENELLLGLLLAVRRAPVAVRSAAFAQAVQRWRAAAAPHAAAEPAPVSRPLAAAVPPPAPSAPPLPPQLAAVATGHAATEPATVHRRPDAKDPAPAPSTPPPPPELAAAELLRPRSLRAHPDDAALSRDDRPRTAANARAAGDAPPPPASDPAVPPRPPGAHSPVATPRQLTVAPPAGSPAPVPSTAEPALEVPAPSAVEEPKALAACETVETALGGLFFLVNLGLHLGLVADFSAPDAGAAADIDPWDLVALLGRELLDEPSPRDPVWPLLARLAGRDKHEPPGRAFSPPDAWRVPPSWLAPWPEAGEWTWSAARGRLRVRHPAGFVVLDVPRTASAPAGELAPYAPTHLRRGRIAAPGRRRPTLRWCQLLAGYARARLARGLGLENPARLDPILLRRPARVEVTPAHVDVVLTLADHPLEIRLSGLDRDPGWLPAAGRHLAFHFR